MSEKKETPLAFSAAFSHLMEAREQQLFRIMERHLVEPHMYSPNSVPISQIMQASTPVLHTQDILRLEWEELQRQMSRHMSTRHEILPNGAVLNTLTSPDTIVINREENHTEKELEIGQ